jgi:hypothetical protein
MVSDEIKSVGAMRLTAKVSNTEQRVESTFASSPCIT